MTDPARCPSCGSPVEAGDVACRRCGAGLPSARTVISGESDLGATSAGETAALEAELREALAPRLQLLERLGSGGMGAVYLARDPALKRLVAVKVLAPELAHDAHARARFAREAEAAAAVSHPSVVSVYQVGELPGSGTAFFVMQYVDGQSLEQLLAPGTAMPVPRLRRIVGDVAAALAAAHERGLVHRDVKPANIVIERDTGRAIVLDFGISAALEQRADAARTRLTGEGISIGTPQYMSPEQAAAEPVTPRSDVYSLGVVAFEMAAGRPPFTGSSPMALAAAHLKDTPPRVASLRSDLDEQLADLIDRCLAKRPADRPAAADIARLLLPATPVIEWPPPGLEPMRARGASLLGTLALVVGCLTLFLALLRYQPLLISPRWHLRQSLAFDGTPIWFFLLGLCAAIILLFLPVLGVRAWRVADLARWARRQGYPWPVIADVLWDVGRDAGDLLNGTGRFVLVGAAERARLLKLRRAQFLVVGSALLAGLALPVAWLWGLAGGWGAGRGEMLPAAEAAVLFAPLLVGFALFVALGRPENTAVPRPGRTRPRLRERARVRAELVAAWLEAAGRGRTRIARWVPRVLLAAAPLALGLAAIHAAAVVMLTQVVAASLMSFSRPHAEEILRAFRAEGFQPEGSDEQARGAADPYAWHRLDSLLAALGTPAGPAVDLAAARALVAAGLVRGAWVPAWVVDSGEIPAVPAPRRALPGVMRRVASALPGPVDRGALDSLALDTLLPSLAAWRRLARSAPLPSFWAYRPGLPGVHTPSDLPPLRYAHLRIPAEINVGAGVLALAEGRAEEAVRRARENLAVARLLLRSPRLREAWHGLAVARGATELLNTIARVTGEVGLATEVEVLRAATRRVWSESWGEAAPALMAEPAAPLGMRFVGDRRLSPAVRVELLLWSVEGFCTSAREVLFGASRRRHLALDSIERALADLDGHAELVRLHRTWLDLWIRNPARAGAVGPGEGVEPPRGLPAGLRHRLAWCLRPVRRL